jgi:hypothetical protein
MLETTSRVAIAGGVTAAKSPAPLKERAALLTLRPGREVIVPILGHFTTQPKFEACIMGPRTCSSKGT